MDRDENAAVNILNRAISEVGLRKVCAWRHRDYPACETRSRSVPKARFFII